MRYLLDTNILLLLAREKEEGKIINEKLKLIGSENQVFFSVVSRGELFSLARQSKWGKHRMEKLEILLSNFGEINISPAIVKKYTDIDVYSQGKETSNPLPTGISARNMGKNDIWIAATAAISYCTLVTTDGDFSHLKDVFINLIELKR